MEKAPYQELCFKCEQTEALFDISTYAQTCPQAPYQADILLKSISGGYRPVRNPDGPITERNASWVPISSLSPDSIFSVIFSFLFKGIQSSTAYNDLISYAPYWKR